VIRQAAASFEDHMAAAQIIPVILSGGSGTRLWPLSPPEKPKQLHALTGTSTMLQMTAARVTDPELFAPPIIVASGRHVAEIEAQLEEIGSRPALSILEPVGRNTAAAIALAALEAPPSALLLVMPSDHVIGLPDRFLAAVRAAMPAAREGHLLTFGIAPERPETGYGYIKRGAVLAEGVFAVDRFVEKPDAATAAAYLADGGYDWNGGIFLFEAGTLLAGLEAHAPGILAQVRRSLDAATRELARVTPDPILFGAVRSQSIDHALMEVHDRVAVVPVQMDWSDVGSWDALHEMGAKDDAGNRASGDTLMIDTRNCLLHTEGPLLVTVGVDDLIVVASGNAVLVMPRGDSQRVKEAVERLAATQAGAPGTRQEGHT
jgi:mannose-1-phosphate guanylyltransferase/mannose-1-phosphate guanylyltransferase/mannose-6-phosphate isomerase